MAGCVSVSELCALTNRAEGNCPRRPSGGGALSFLVTVRCYRSSGLVIRITDRVDQGLGVVKLNVFRAVMGEDLFRVRRQFEPARLGQRGLSSYSRCFGVSGGSRPGGRYRGFRT